MNTHAPSWLVLSSVATADIRESTLIPAVLFTTLALVVVLLRWYSRVCLSPGICCIEEYFVSGALVSIRLCFLESLAKIQEALVDGNDGCRRWR
jgi:hypothetical protein